MPWKPLPDDIPLDHEALTPAEPGVADASSPAPAPAAGAPADPQTAAPSLTPLPDDAQLDSEEPAQPPAIAAHVAPEKGVNATPTYTEQGFADTMEPEKKYHSSLSDKDQAEYETFFADPKKPPNPEFLRRWFHEKTGAYMGNADEIVKHFTDTGQYSTTQKFNFPTKPGGPMDAYGRHLANSILGDWGAEISAPVAAVLPGGDRPNVWNSDESFSTLTGQNADLTRAQLDRDTADHYIASPLGEVTGVLATIPVGGEAANLARLGKLGETGRAVAGGVVGGGVYGSGAAGPGHRLEGGATGAVVAPVVGALSKLPVAGYRAGQTVLTGSPGLARRIIAKAIKDDANTPESVGQDITAAHANDVPMGLGDTGENARGLLAASSRTSGMARTIARDALEERQAGLADRVTKTIERDLGPVANPHKVADDLMTKARDDAQPLYEAAYARPGAPEFAQKIAPLLQRPSMKKGLAYAYRVAKEEGRDPETLGLTTVRDRTTTILDGSGNPITVPEVEMTKTPSWQTLDYVKRGMDDVVEGYKDNVTGKYNFDTEGNAMNNTLRSYLKAFDTANPDYGAARAAYAGPVKGISALNAGRKFLSLTADDIEARMRDMSPFERQMAAVGTRRAMAELVASKGDTADVVHALVGTGKKRAMLARLFGDRKQFQRFVETLGQEREGFRTFKQARLGSPTSPNLADDTALEVATTAGELMVHGGLPVATAIRKSIKFLGREISDKAKQQIAAMLSDTNPARIRELAAELRAQAVKRGLRIRRTNAVTNAVGKSAVVLQPQRQ